MSRVWLTLSIVFVAPLAAADDDSEFFERKIRPLLAANCHSCHTNSRMGGLRLDSREAVMAGGKTGPAIVPGKPAESLLIQAVKRTHERLKMPPTAPLSAADVALLEEWVKRGAAWPQAPVPKGAPIAITKEQREFWSFRPVKKPALPPVKNKAWVRSDVDRFVLAKLEQSGLTPIPAADKRTWLRRITLDLTGLPPTPEEVAAFEKDTSPQARARVIDHLLESPHYGERWGRYWLDLARYSDGQLAAGTDTPLPNAYRYRDWVVEAFNKDMPYDKFVRAQIAADAMNDPAMLPGLGFQSLGAGANDQVDVTTKVFLGLTVGCAQCHDHKYDPIPTRDYYSLLGVFRGTRNEEHPLVPKSDVDAYQAVKKQIDERKEIIADFIIVQQRQLVDLLARSTARYMVAAWKIAQGQTPDKAGLDQETLDRWVKYLADPNREHPYLKDWFALVAGKPTEDQVRAAADRYQAFALDLIERSKEVDDKNYVAFGGKKGMKDERTRQYTNIVSLPVLDFYQWRELASGPYNIDGFRAPAGVFYYDAKAIERFLGGHSKDYLAQLRSEVAEFEKKLPPMYPFLHAVKDTAEPKDIRVAIRGDANTPGEIAPRRFLAVLCNGEPAPFQKGSGRAELAEAIGTASNPLTARVMVNRIWQHHFGVGIVKSASNFGQMGERPTHPELLDYLAARFVESGWSVKTIHREILLSATYGLSVARDEKNETADPANRLLWRANLVHRLDMEALRDSILAVSGKLDSKVGGAAAPLAPENVRRSLYLTISRTRLDPAMALFDFPDANATTEERPVTAGPLQGLFFLNSKFVQEQSRALHQRLEREAGADAASRIRRAYALLYGRAPDAQELKLGSDFVASGEPKAWSQYLQALLGSAEFTSVN
ncbi:MAG: PSD1 and planctomycete cytochrome C domain-containing protein [Bryobacteraceae bacterium]